MRIKASRLRSWLRARAFRSRSELIEVQCNDHWQLEPVFHLLDGRARPANCATNSAAAEKNVTPDNAQAP